MGCYPQLVTPVPVRFFFLSLPASKGDSFSRDTCDSSLGCLSRLRVWRLAKSFRLEHDTAAIDLFGFNLGPCPCR
jgi:hypothetical protein